MTSTAQDSDSSDRIDCLRRLAKMQVTPSPDGSVNRDSVIFLAKFALGHSDNVMYASGAVRCSGATLAQISEIVELLARVPQEAVDADSFAERVSAELGIPLVHQRAFPSIAPMPTEEDRARRVAFEREQEARATADRARAEADEQLDRGIADLLNIDVRKIDNEWGWELTDGGTWFSPSSDGAIAFQLICSFRLNVTFSADDVAVSFSLNRNQVGTFSVSASSYGDSLPRAVCVAALRKAELDRHLR